MNLTLESTEKIPRKQDNCHIIASFGRESEFGDARLATLEIQIPRAWLDFTRAYLEWTNPEEGKEACFSHLMQSMAEAAIVMLLDEVWGQNHTKAEEFVERFGLQEIAPAHYSPHNQDGFGCCQCGSALEHEMQEGSGISPSQRELKNPDDVLSKYPEVIEKIVRITECALILELDNPLFGSPDRERVKITSEEYLQLWDNYVEKRRID